jgi:branched-chain amino acid transport system ATP-binding protein
LKILELRSVSSGYGTTEIICDISLSVANGKIMCILGRNGAGKTTLLKTIVALLPIRKGEILYKESSIVGRKPYEISRAGIVYAPQGDENAIFPNLNVIDNLCMGLPRKALKEEAVETLLEYFPVLIKRRTQKAGTLSGGEKKMLILFRTLIRKPQLMLLDEITEGIQPLLINTIENVILSANRNNRTTVLIIEQNVNFTLRMAHNFAVMKQGFIAEYGKVSEDARAKIEKHMVI